MGNQSLPKYSSIIPMTTPRIPHFLIIGAAKSATTWWQHALSKHPSIYIPLTELHHFSFQYQHANPLPPAYLDNFHKAKPQQVIGENSNSYFPHPECAARIHKALPGVKLIVSLRNPIARAYSDWEMRLRQGLLVQNIQAFLDPDHVPDFEFLRKGLYAHQLQPYVSRFGNDRVLILITDDLKEDAQSEFQTVCRFLNVDDNVLLKNLGREINTRDQKAVFPGLRRRIERTGVGGMALQALRQTPVHEMARKLFGRSLQSPPMPEVIRQKLYTYYRDDVHRLSDMLNRDLTPWLA